MRGDVGVEMTFLEKNTTKLRITKEIVLQIKTDYKNNPLNSKNIKRRYSEQLELL